MNEHWLESHELGKYAELFAENDVDLEASYLLIDPELEKAGASLGHREKLRTVISTYRVSGQMHP